MATPRKPAAKPARKRTTKAKTKVVLTPATEPAVDLINAEADAVQEHHEPATPAANVTPEEKQAKLEAYNTLKQAGLTPPAELAQEVEGWIKGLQEQRERQQEALAQAAAQREQDVAEANINGPWYIRNCYPAQFNLRLDRQHGEGQRRIMLKARGEPGDLHPLKDEDLSDPVLRQNVGLGLCEVIPAGEAQEIISKQTTNMGRRVHAPLAVLRNELNQPYAQGAVKVEAEFNSQGVTVATVDPRAMQGQMHDRELGGTRATGGITRVQPGQAPEPQFTHPGQATSVVSGFVPTGGNPAIITQGGMAPPAVANDIAQRAQGVREATMHRGPGDITVTVDPVQRT